LAKDFVMLKWILAPQTMPKYLIINVMQNNPLNTYYLWEKILNSQAKNFKTKKIKLNEKNYLIAIAL
jgi:hypothetical protein